MRKAIRKRLRLPGGAGHCMLDTTQLTVRQLSQKSQRQMYPGRINPAYARQYQRHLPDYSGQVAS
jgi:hypothetical protein